MTVDALHWKSEYASGYAPMDEDHREFLDCVGTLMTCDDADLPSALDAFSNHAISHFGEEDRLMATNAYPSAGCHVEEHAAVLGSLAEVQQALTRGNSSVVRRFASERLDLSRQCGHHLSKGLMPSRPLRMARHKRSSMEE
jgi:hemerythrin